MSSGSSSPGQTLPFPGELPHSGFPRAITELLLPADTDVLTLHPARLQGVSLGAGSWALGAEGWMDHTLRNSGASPQSPFALRAVPALQDGTSSSKSPFGAEHGWGCPACVPQTSSSCSACARRCAQGNAQFSALLRLAAGMHTPSIPFSPLSVETRAHPSCSLHQSHLHPCCWLHLLSS